MDPHAVRDIPAEDPDAADNQFKLGVYLAATGVGFSLIRSLALLGVLFVWVGLAVAVRGNVWLRWGGMLLVAALVGWLGTWLRP